MSNGRQLLDRRCPAMSVARTRLAHALAVVGAVTALNVGLLAAAAAPASAAIDTFLKIDGPVVKGE
jgi:hypothetical protein